MYRTSCAPGGRGKGMILQWSKSGFWYLLGFLGQKVYFLGYKSYFVTPNRRSWTSVSFSGISFKCPTIIPVRYMGAHQVVMGSSELQHSFLCECQASAYNQRKIRVDVGYLCFQSSKETIFSGYPCAVIHSYNHLWRHDSQSFS